MIPMLAKVKNLVNLFACSGCTMRSIALLC